MRVCTFASIRTRWSFYIVGLSLDSAAGLEVEVEEEANVVLRSGPRWFVLPMNHLTQTRRAPLPSFTWTACLFGQAGWHRKTWLLRLKEPLSIQVFSNLHLYITLSKVKMQATLFYFIRQVFSNLHFYITLSKVKMPATLFYFIRLKLQMKLCYFHRSQVKMELCCDNIP